VGVAVTAAIRPAVRPDQAGRDNAVPAARAAGGPDDKIGQSDAYKALPGATYGGGRGGGWVAVEIPLASGKPASPHGPSVKTLSGGHDYRC